jgi:hypothetical protein
MIELLGLRGCENTIIGNEYMRGVSGGEKRRVTVGEILLGPGKAVFLDEPTSGLDSSTAEDIMKALRQWTTITNGSLVAALLQPTPEVFNLFDTLILLRDGRCVYNGPRADIIPYLESQGSGVFLIHCQCRTSTVLYGWVMVLPIGIYCPSDADYADFITEYLSIPQVVYARQLRNNTQPPSLTENIPTPMSTPHSGASSPHVVVEESKMAPPSPTNGLKVHVDPSSMNVTRSPKQGPITPHKTPSKAAPPIPVTRHIGPGELPVPSTMTVDGYIAPAAPAPLPYQAISRLTYAVPKKDSHDDTLHLATAKVIAESNGDVPLTAPAMEKAFRESKRYQYYRDHIAGHQEASKNPTGTPLESPFAKAQYGNEYAHSFQEHTKLCVKRQAVLMSRQVDLIIPRIGQAIIIGLILGSLFYGSSESDFHLRVGLLLLACDYLSCKSLSIIPRSASGVRVDFECVDE